MFDFINNEMIAGVLNWLVMIIPAIGAFIVGLRKYSSKALKAIKLAAEAFDLLDKASYALSPESEGGEKLTAKEIKDLQKEFDDVKVAWDNLKINVKKK